VNERERLRKSWCGKERGRPFGFAGACSVAEVQEGLKMMERALLVLRIRHFEILKGTGA